MYLEIITPEAVLFSGEVDSVAVPGVKGAFQMLNNHAPIVSILDSGQVKIHVHNQEAFDFDNLPDKITSAAEDKNLLVLDINSGTVEMKANKVVVLAD